MDLDTYSWPGPFTPFDHQKVTAKFVLDHARCFVLNDMGTGKTASVLWAADYLMSIGAIRKALVVAPLSTLERVWRDEAFKLLMHRRTQLLWHRTGATRRELYAEQWDIGVINFDGIKVLEDQIMNDPELDMLIVDECTAYKNGQTARWKLMRRLSADKRRVVMMTGTPTPQAPSDAWAQAKLLGCNPAVPKFFGSFRRATMKEVTEHKWVPKPGGYEKAFELLQPAIRFKKEDCIDLPPITYQSWEVDLSPAQRKAYKSMQKKMKIEWENHGQALPARNAADKINKLRQIACGVVKDTKTEEYIGLPMRPRIEAIFEAIEMAQAKVIVVVPFKGAIYHVASFIKKRYTVAVVNGDVSMSKRGEIIRQFCETPDPHVLLVHPKVMAHGLTLTVADTMVFFAPIYSNEETQQIIQRINRPGQTRSMTVVQVGAVPLEWSIYNDVERRAEGESMLLSMYADAMSEAA